MHLRAFALVAAVTAVACVPARRPPIYRVEQRFALEPSPTETHADPAAAPALAAARTLAFLPPGECRGDVEIEVDAAPRPTAIVCESAVARLEAAAIDAGYDVVSWRALAGEGPLLERARAAGVDLLFVVDELTTGAAPEDLYTTTSTRVVDERSGAEVTLRDPATTAARCAAELSPALAPELAVVLDVELVAVADGRVLWTYRRTHDPARGAREALATQRYTATVGALPVGEANWKIATGAIGITVGLPTLLATGIVDATDEDFDAPRPVYAAGLALLAMGIYSVATVNSETHWVYSPADDVACLPAHATLAADLLQPLPGSPTAGCDDGCHRAIAQVDHAVDDLFSELRRVR